MLNSLRVNCCYIGADTECDEKAKHRLVPTSAGGGQSLALRSKREGTVVFAGNQPFALKPCDCLSDGNFANSKQFGTSHETFKLRVTLS